MLTYTLIPWHCDLAKKQLFKVAYVREIYGPFENVSNVLIMRSRILQIEQYLYGWYLFIYLILLFFFFIVNFVIH